MSEQGLCCIGTSCQPADKEACREWGGKFIEKDDDDDGICLTTMALNHYLFRVRDPVLLLYAGGTYNSLYEVKDRVLENSPLGEIFLNYNREFANKEVKKIITSHPRIFRDAVYVFLVAASFSRAILREMTSPGSETERLWTQEAAAHVDRVIDRIKKVTKIEQHHLALNHLHIVNQRCINLNPREVLEIIQSGETFIS